MYLSKARGSSAAFVLMFALVFATSLSAREPKKPKSSNPEAQAHIDKAWAALDHNIGIKELDVAIYHLDKALDVDPDNVEILVELADECYFRGALMPHDTQEKLEARNKYFQKGYDAALKSLAIKETAGGQAWATANLGEMKRYENFISQAAALPEINQRLDWISENDKEYKYGMVSRFWAGIMTRAPDAIVRLMGEDPDQIKKDLEESIDEHPDYVENYIFKAELLKSAGEKLSAIKVLERALTIDPDSIPTERSYNRMLQKDARNHWRKWTGKEYPEKRR